VSLHWDTLVPAARRRKKGETDPLQDLVSRNAATPPPSPSNSTDEPHNNKKIPDAKARLKEVESQLKETKQSFKSNVAPQLAKPDFFSRVAASSIPRDEHKTLFNKVANDVAASHKEALTNFLRLVE